MFRFLDHPSETLVEVEGASPEEVFRDAALALFELMTDVSKLKVEEERDIELESSERHLLLIDWLNHLILLHETEKLFFCEFEIRISGGSIYRLQARAGAQKIKPDHEKRLQVKSATYGSLRWTESDRRHLVRFVLDV
jgi:SHS2 domain-containing protein